DIAYRRAVLAGLAAVAADEAGVDRIAGRRAAAVELERDVVELVPRVEFGDVGVFAGDRHCGHEVAGVLAWIEGDRLVAQKTGERLTDRRLEAAKEVVERLILEHQHDHVAYRR